MDCPGRPTILIVSSTWWAFPAKLAVAFAATGAIIDVVCPGHSPLKVTSSVRRTFRYGAINPLRALKSAIAQVRPALIIPCDDRAVGHLHSLHAQSRTNSPEIAEAIERSLGKPENFGIAERRSDLIDLARKLGIRAPLMLRVEAKQEVAQGLLQVGLPAIMKVDGTWGGLGVKVVHTAKQAALAFVELSRPLSVSRAMIHFLRDKDPFSLPGCLHRERPVVNIQRFVSGRPANCTVACWNGEVLSYIGAEVLSASSEFGASCVVRIIEHANMRRAATGLVRRLGLSGFCGFDFMIDTAGVAHLVEMNARATPLTHLALGVGRDPVAALSSVVLGSVSTRIPVTTCDIISFFPQALNLHPSNALPRASFYDVPWEEAELVRELIRRPWPEREILATLMRLGRRRLDSWRGLPTSKPFSFNAAGTTAMAGGDPLRTLRGENWVKALSVQAPLFSRSAIDREFDPPRVWFPAD